jgi:hypothetical protein
VLHLLRAPDRLHRIVIGFGDPPVCLLEMCDRAAQVSAKHAEGLCYEQDYDERED